MLLKPHPAARGPDGVGHQVGVNNGAAGWEIGVTKDGTPTRGVGDVGSLLQGVTTFLPEVARAGDGLRAELNQNLSTG